MLFFVIVYLSIAVAGVDVIFDLYARTLYLFAHCQVDAM